MIYIRVGEFRSPTPITQQNFGFVGGDWIQFHVWVQINHSHHSTWYPLGLGNSEHPPSLLNMISIGGWEIQSTHSHHSTWYPIGLGNSEHPITQQNLGFVGGDWIQFHLWVQINHSRHSTWYPLGLGNSEHPLPLLNMIPIRIGEFSAPTAVIQHDIH